MAYEDGPGSTPDMPADLPDLACFVADGTGRVVGWSDRARDVFGWTAAEMSGRPVAAVLPSRDLPAPATAVVAGRHRDGHALRLAVRVSPMESSGGDGLLVVSAVDVDTEPWWAVNRSVLERFLGALPFGVAVLGPDLRYVWLNRTMEEMAGVRMAQRLGRRIAEVLPDLDPEGMEAQLRSTLASGTPVREYEYRGFTPADPEREHVYATSFFRLDDTAGRVLGVGYMGADVTDRERAQDRLALLTDSAATIGSSLDVMRTAEELASSAVPRLADTVWVDLFEPILRGGEPEPETDVSTLVRVAHSSVRPAGPETAIPLGQAPLYDEDSPAVRCLLERRALLEPDHRSATDTLPAGGTKDGERTGRARPSSVMAVPVAARGIHLGVAVFLRGAGRERFEDADLRLAAEFVTRAAIALDNARRYTREHAASLTLQRSLLPRRTGGGASLDTAARYLPAGAPGGVGGDWFDVIPLSAGRCALVVGDVVGRGIAAAAAMGRLRMSVRTLAATDPAPDELLARLDDLVLRLIDEDEAAAETTHSAGRTLLGATCLYAVYDPVSCRLTAARAGHPPPVVRAADGSAALAELPAGPPLGLGSMPFEAAELELPQDSVIALFTNGVLGAWARDPDAGMRRLLRGLENSGGGELEQACDHVLEAMQVHGARDDAALLLARPSPFGPDQVGSWNLRSDPAVVGTARALVSRALAQWGLDEQVFTAELVVSELVTNAIRYGGPDIRLRLIRHTVLTCEVFDGSSTAPRLRHARTSDEGGRGLFLVAQMADRWGTRYVPEGKVVWAELRLTEH